MFVASILPVGVCKKLINSDEVISDSNDIKMDLEESRGVVSRWEVSGVINHIVILSYHSCFVLIRRVNLWWIIRIIWASLTISSLTIGVKRYVSK